MMNGIDINYIINEAQNYDDGYGEFIFLMILNVQKSNAINEMVNHLVYIKLRVFDVIN